MLDDVIRYCLISSVFKPIRVIGQNERAMRAQINVLLQAPFGTGKTTLLQEIERRELGHIFRGWTEPAMLGSIKKDGTIIPPMTLMCAGKTVLIDEFQAIPHPLKTPLLHLMEEQRAERVLANRFPGEQKLSGKHYYIYVKDGYLSCHIRASYIVCCSKLNLTNHTERMLLSRCIQCHMNVTYDDILHKSDVYLDDIHELRQQLEQYEGVYEQSEIETILNATLRVIKKRKLPPNYTYRVAGDVIRIKNVIEAAGFKKGYRKYIHFITSGVLGQKLTVTDLNILRALSANGREHMKIEELLKETKVCKSYLLSRLEHLEELKFIRRAGDYVSLIVEDSL